MIDPETGNPVAIMRTSDRNAFRACRRKWNFSSNHRMNLGRKSPAAPLWLGTGIHFALEDFHGHRKYTTAEQAFEVYVKAGTLYAQDTGKLLPDDLEELTRLGCGMMSYYENEWLPARYEYKPYVLNGEIQLEVSCKVKIPLPELANFIEPKSGKPYAPYLIYSATFDGVFMDPSGLGVWIMEYKTAAMFSTTHLDLDPQINVYYWLASQMYDIPVLGVLYQQHRKTLPNEPRILKNGMLSVAKNQATTRSRYRKAGVALYGEISGWPSEAVELLNTMAMTETDQVDDFVRRDFVYRNHRAGEAELQHIKDEALEMFNPDLNIYPNPDRSCFRMCSFTDPCKSMQDGSDYEFLLQDDYEERPKSYDPWRVKLGDIAKQMQQLKINHDLDDAMRDSAVKQYDQILATTQKET